MRITRTMTITVTARLGAFFAATLIAVALSAQDDQPPFVQDPSGGSGTSGGCATCYLKGYGDLVTLRCGSPAPGGRGYQNCRIESYPEGTYCFTDGNQCCVD